MSEEKTEKHTPGPWHSGPLNKYTIYDRFGSKIGNTFHGVIAVQVSDEACEANARLMAAAPDMLAALRRAVLALAFAAESSEAMKDDYKVVSDAIEKATGQS